LNPARFFLKPFPGEGNPAGVKIEGAIARRAETLSVRFEVRGDLSMVAIPVDEEAPRRKDRLWEETCLELFLGTEDSERYWEFNLSPSGNWNIYRFTRYREGMREEPAIMSLPYDIRRDPEALVLTAEIRLEKIVPAGKGLAATAAAVIRTTDGAKSHWAQAHPALHPDFHRREGFMMILS